MSMWKKIALTLSISLLVLASLSVIGWITFQEKIRLAVQDYQSKQQLSHSQPSGTQSSEQPVLETTTEANEALKRLEGWLRTLEENNVPRTDY